MERTGSNYQTAEWPAIRHSRHWWLSWCVVAVTCIVLAHLADGWAWANMRDLRINEKDIGRFFRSFGYVPTFLVIATALWLHDRGKPRWGWRGGFVLLAPIAGGAVAEVLKMMVRRLRPSADAFGYAFRPFTEDLFSTRGLGMPSSHTMVAFAGATMMARLFPRAWGLWYVVAAGCALTRVLALGHFLSDAVVGAMGGFLVGDLLSRTRAFQWTTPHAPEFGKRDASGRP